MTEEHRSASQQPDPIEPRGAPPTSDAGFGLPAWRYICELFLRHNLEPPPTRLRDELVTHLTAYRVCPPEGERDMLHFGGGLRVWGSDEAIQYLVQTIDRAGRDHEND